MATQGFLPPLVAFIVFNKSLATKQGCQKRGELEISSAMIPESRVKFATTFQRLLGSWEQAPQAAGF
jgi:uncharacterized membrane protein